MKALIVIFGKDSSGGEACQYDYCAGGPGKVIERKRNPETGLWGPELVKQGDLSETNSIFGRFVRSEQVWNGFEFVAGPMPSLFERIV